MSPQGHQEDLHNSETMENNNNNVQKGEFNTDKVQISWRTQ